MDRLNEMVRATKKRKKEKERRSAQQSPSIWGVGEIPPIYPCPISMGNPGFDFSFDISTQPGHLFMPF